MLLGNTVNYVWRHADVIGKGSTALVFKGAHSDTGVPVAIKVFTYTYLIDHEIEVMRTLNHENVVKLLAVENDLSTNMPVLVMELCELGSMMKVLEQPKNAYGIPEQEFLTVLTHVCAGMKYMRDRKLVHRDMKPGNIMKFISDDGRIIYKLGDFGTARELEDDEPFKTICGTYEYLHPNVFKGIVANQGKKVHFDTNVDLWSIGVTLYQLITGRIPFVTFNQGQRDKMNLKLYEIVTKKPSGVISGEQRSENGTVEWSSTLPPQCQLSEGLKMLIVPLLARLLESDKEKTLSFSQFFDEVDAITRKVIIHVFYFNHVSFLELFLEPTELLSNIHEHIYQQTSIITDNQVLIFNNNLTNEIFIPHTTAQDVKGNTRENPIFLYDINDNNILLPEQSRLLKFPEYPHKMAMQKDTLLTKAICEYGYLYKRRIEDLTEQDELLKTAAYNLSQLLARMERSLYINSTGFVVFQAAVLNNTQSLMQHKELLQILRIEANEIISNIEQFHQQYSNLDTSSDRLIQTIKRLKCPCEVRAAQRAHRLMERLEASYLYLKNDSDKSSLCSTDLQFHNLEIRRIKNYCKELDSLLGENLQVMQKVIDNLVADWYKEMEITYTKAKYLELEFRKCYSKFLNLHNLMQKKRNGMSTILQTLEEQIPDIKSEVENIAKKLTEILQDNA